MSDYECADRPHTLCHMLEILETRRLALKRYVMDPTVEFFVSFVRIPHVTGEWTD